VGDWILIYFPDETGQLHKLSRPWHGPYRIISHDDPDITATKIFFPGDLSIQVHQSQVCKCPPSFPNDKVKKDQNLVVLQNNFLESWML